MFGFLNGSGKSHADNKNTHLLSEKPQDSPSLVVGGGCFWCLEWEFNALEGILYTESGYQGGQLDNPKYRDITSGKTGHAEVVRVFYNPDIIKPEAILDHFLRKAHDPTQLNRQGVDVGTQYRSVIFYDDDAAKELSQSVIDEVNASGEWDDPIVTTLEPSATFFAAEEYHQDYYEKYEAETGQSHIRVIMKEKKKAKAQ